MGEAPDIREREDCPTGKVCCWTCDQHKPPPQPPDPFRKPGR